MLLWESVDSWQGLSRSRVEVSNGQSDDSGDVVDNATRISTVYVRCIVDQMLDNWEMSAPPNTVLNGPDSKERA